MKKYLINYAHRRFFESRKKNSITGLEIGGFDEAISYGIDDLDPEFRRRNRAILQAQRGAGYWIWKPYIVLKTLGAVAEGDWVFYCDSGAYFVHSIDPLIDYCLSERNEILLFSPGSHFFDIGKWTKRDCFYLMNLDDEKYRRLPQVGAGFVLCRKTPAVKRFMEKWLFFCTDERIVTDMPNVCGLENHPEFVEHRHDQSVLSLLGYHENVPMFPHVTDFADDYRPPFMPRIIVSTRDPN